MSVFYVALFAIFSAYFGVMNPSAFWSSVAELAIFFGAVASLHYAAYRGVERSKWWARSISVMLGTVLLLGFPIGTAIGVYLLYLSVGAWEKPQPSERA